MTIQEFDSVPDILRALLKNGDEKPMSIRQLSRKLGYSSDRTVGMVMQGHREMAPDMLKRLADYAGWDGRDKEYLCLLTEKQKKTRLGLATAAIESELREHKQKAGKDRRVDAVDLSGLTAWFAYVILEVLSDAGPQTAEQIRAVLRTDVELAEVEKTLEALLILNFIGRGEEGFFRALAPNEFVTTAPDIPSLTIRAIHRAQLERAIATIEEQSIFEREMIAKTLTVSAERIPHLKKKIREMMDELATQFMAPESPDAVVSQFNFQFYQQTRPKV